MPRLAGLVAALAVALGLIAASAGPASAATVTIRITNGLSDASVTVAPGTTVRFVNADDERHRMRSQSGPDDFDSGNLEPGESFAVRLTAVGTYTYLDERDDDDARYVGRIVVAAAGGGGSTGGGSTAGGSTGGSGGAAASASVGMAGRSFNPGTVTIAAGGSVTFRNDDDDEHTVTSTTGAFNSGTIAAGGSYRRTFPSAGTFDYLCALHSDMTGTVVVKAAGGTVPAPTPKPTPAPSPTPAATAPGANAPAPVEVEARDFSFEAADLRVAVGTTVTWRNVGQAPHTVTADDGSFDSAMIAAGGAFSRTFETAGTYPYLCVFHPGMTGVVDVTAGGTAPATPEPSGTAAAPTSEPTASADPTAAPAATATATTDPDPVAAGGGSVATPPAKGSGTAAPTTRVIRLPDADVLLRVGFAALIVVAGAVLFGRTIRSSVRPAPDRSMTTLE